jgi:hypothetical protein
MPGPDRVDLFLTVDPATATVQPSYSVTTNGFTQARVNVGGPEPIPSTWFKGVNLGLAVGIISTSRGAAPEFPATWDLIEVVDGDGSGGDTTAPTITAVSPSEGATGVNPTTKITTTFSEALTPTSVNPTTFSIVKAGTATAVAATVTYDAASQVATLRPSRKLESGVTYTATVKGGASGIEDLAGNQLAADKLWSFTTRPR